MDWDDAAVEYHKQTFAHDDQLSSLAAEWQRELVALMLVNREVNNGAYLQFLSNHGREAYAYASQALRKIGAHRMADIIDRCQALVDEHFPSEGKSSDELRLLLPNPIIGREGKLVKGAGSLLPDSVLRRITELSYEFMAYPDDVGDLAESYYRSLIDGASATPET
jgi:hypothetical protein